MEIKISISCKFNQGITGTKIGDRTKSLMKSASKIVRADEGFLYDTL